MKRIWQGSLVCAVVTAAAGWTPWLVAAESSPSAETNSRPGVYRIYPLLDGHCQIRGDHAFQGGSEDEVYDYALYTWLVLGGDKPILIDAGISDVAEMNKGAAGVLYQPIYKKPGENCRDQLRKFGLTPDDIGHVFITHMHFDHVDDLLLYRNARIHVGRKEWELGSRTEATWLHGKILGAYHSDPDFRKRMQLVDDGEVLPGIESFWVGGHTPGSTAYRVRTEHGWAVLTGDTVSLLANLERNIPPGVFTSLDECLNAFKTIRAKADYVLASHDPGAVVLWPPNPGQTPRYTIRAIKVGECQVRDYITFQGGPHEKTRTFFLYVWVIEGGEHPIIVDTGPKDPEGFSKGTAAYIPGGVKQLPEERTPEALRRHGIDLADVSHVIATHLHGDHYDYFDAFPNARLVVNRREFEEGRDPYTGGTPDVRNLAPGVAKALTERPEALQLVGDEEVVPGVRVFPLGCHTPGSQGVCVQTHMGPAVLTGDVVYKYENIEKNRPTQSPNPEPCMAAMERIRSMADIVLPAHDPLTLERWPDGIIGAREASGEKIEVPGVTLLVPPQMSRPLRYSLAQLSEFCRISASIQTVQQPGWTDGQGMVVLVGRESAEKHAPWLCRRVPWAELGEEGFALRLGYRGKIPVLVAAGASDAGTRQAVLTVIRELDVSRLPATLPADLDIIETPAFALRGMYAHQHWAYNYPYALRTWTVEDWQKYVDLLALMRVNLFQIWSMAGILPVPLSAEDEAFLRRYPPVIDHARQNHGMQVWIGECANNMCDRRDLPPAADRDYFAVESLKNPADPAQMAQLRAAREAYYRVCDNADGYWVIDSDPGKWKGSPSNEFVDILMMNRELITSSTKLGPEAKLVYWMWFSWGTGSREQNWRDTLTDLKQRAPEPWWMTYANAEHGKIVDELGLTDRAVYYPYGAVEPEPSLPFTTVVPQGLRNAMDVPERIGKIRGVMANAQTPLCQLPNMHYFQRSAWNMDLRHQGTQAAMSELARLIYPEQAQLLTKAWLSLGSDQAPRAGELADKLESLAKRNGLGRPGPIGIKLFPDYGQVARDLAVQLRIHAAARRFCARAVDPNLEDAELVKDLLDYCLRSLAWRKHNGFRNYGTNGYNFFPLREAAHKRWWRDNRFNPHVLQTLKREMKAGYEDWEAELILLPLRQ